MVIGYAYYEENANTLAVAAIANNDTHGVQDAGGAVTPETAPLLMVQRLHYQDTFT